MLTICTKGHDGLHSWEFQKTFEGGDHYVCKNEGCEATLFEPTDCYGG